MPHEFHQLIVYKCLQTLYDKVGSATSSELYRRRIEDEIDMTSLVNNETCLACEG